MITRTAVSRIGVIAALFAAATGAMAAPALAAEGDEVIQNGEFIVWRDCDFKGPFFDFAKDHKNYDDIDFHEEEEDEEPTPVDDNTSGVANFSTVNSVNAYFLPRYAGPRLVVLPGQEINLCTTFEAFDDELSSHHF